MTSAMRHLLIRFISVAVLCTAGCITLPTPFERIKDNKPRLIDFMYEPAEASPGDTVTLRALFAGRELSPADINWRFSSSVLKNLAGIDSAYDTHPLDATIDTCYFSDNTSCLRARFVIPENCIRQSPMVRENFSAIASSLPDSLLPEGFTPGSFDETISMIDSLSRIVAVADTPTLLAMATLMPDVVSQLPMLSQLLTVPVRIFADIIGDHTIESDYAVSYTPRFARLPGSRLYPNHNPVIDSVVVFKVKGSTVMTYDPYGPDVERFHLKGSRDSAVVIPIDVGYSYFIEAAAHDRDTVITLGDLAGGAATAKLEDFGAEWMFRLDSAEAAGYNTNQLMFISPLGDLDGALAPPQKGKVVHFTIWVQVTDSKLGILNRSQGSAVAEVTGMFSYTDAYLKQFK